MNYPKLFRFDAFSSGQKVAPSMNKKEEAPASQHVSQKVGCPDSVIYNKYPSSNLSIININNSNNIQKKYNKFLSKERKGVDKETEAYYQDPI